MVFVDFHGLGAVWLSNGLVNGEYGQMIGNDGDRIYIMMSVCLCFTKNYHFLHVSHEK